MDGTTSTLHEIKISELPVATAANATDQLEANQAGTTRSITLDQVSATVAASAAIDDAIGDAIGAIPPAAALMADGTVALPGMPFALDLDTGFYRPASNQLALALGGANFLTTSGPAATNGGVLAINGAISAQPTIATYQSSAGAVHTTTSTITQAAADGTSEPRNIINRLQMYGANIYAKAYTQYNGIDHYGTNTLVTGNTLHNYFALHNTGNVTNGKLVFGHYWFDNGGSVTNSSTVFEAGSTTYDGTVGGFTNNITGFYVGVLGHATRCGGVFGFNVTEQSAVNGVQAYRSEVAAGAQKWAFFDAGGAGIFTSGNLQVAGGLTFTGAGVTYTQNWTTSRAIGVASGSVIPFQQTVTYSSDGTASVIANNDSTVSSGANSITLAQGRRQVLTLGATAGTTATAIGQQSIVALNNAGALTAGHGFNAAFQITGAGNVATFSHFLTSNATYSSTGIAAIVEGFTVTGIGHATLVTNAYGVRVYDTSASASVQGVRIETTSGTGKFAILTSGTADSAFLGNVRVGSNTAPTVALDVTGDIAGTNVNASTGGSFRVGNRGLIGSTVDGNLLLRNFAGTSFGLIQLGGTTSAFPSIKRNATALNFRLANDGADCDITAGMITAMAGTAIAAGAATQAFIKGSSTANFGVYYGSGAPTFTAAANSLYLRSDGSTTTTRMYVNTTGSTTWATVTTSA